MGDKHQLLLKLMFNNYYEEERRFNTITSKIAAMIAITGVMFSIQTTLLINTYAMFSTNCRYIIICSIISCLLALTLFIYVYAFTSNSFKSAPKPEWLLEKAKNKKNKKEDVIKALLYKLPKTMKHNFNSMSKKIKISQVGFIFLIISCFLILISIFLLNS